MVWKTSFWGKFQVNSVLPSCFPTMFGSICRKTASMGEQVAKLLRYNEVFFFFKAILSFLLKKVGLDSISIEKSFFMDNSKVHKLK